MKMSAPSTLDELKELLALTEQCAAQARAAKQQARRYAAHFKANSEEFRKQAARSPFPEIQARLLRIAASNERLSDIAEGVRVAADAKGQLVPPEPPKRSDQAAVTRTEDPVSQARRHVAEAEGRIERQKALVARLSSGNKYLSLAHQAKEILCTLQQTLRLARDHLDFELNK
jgi:hypothetical protein